MCGIGAIFTREPLEAAESLVAAMMQQQRHRGPDLQAVQLSANGRAALGHARRVELEDLPVEVGALLTARLAGGMRGEVAPARFTPIAWHRLSIPPRLEVTLLDTQTTLRTQMVRARDIGATPALAY